MFCIIQTPLKPRQHGALQILYFFVLYSKLLQQGVWAENFAVTKSSEFFIGGDCRVTNKVSFYGSVMRFTHALKNQIKCTHLLCAILQLLTCNWSSFLEVTPGQAESLKTIFEDYCSRFALLSLNPLCKSTEGSSQYASQLQKSPIDLILFLPSVL